MEYYYKTNCKYHHLQINKQTKKSGDFHSTENAWTCIHSRVKKFPVTKKLKTESPVTNV